MMLFKVTLWLMSRVKQILKVWKKFRPVTGTLEISLLADLWRYFDLS